MVRCTVGAAMIAAKLEMVAPEIVTPNARWDERSVRTPTPVVGLVERISVETAIGVERGGYAFARSGALSFVSISAGAYYSCGISTDGGAYCWGQGEPGQLGHGSRVTMPAPIAVADWR